MMLIQLNSIDITHFGGPVDAEISVPELVLQNDLCPHQDFVYLSAPDEKAGDMLFQFHGKVNCFFNEIQQDKAFIDCVCKHRFIIETDHYIEENSGQPGILCQHTDFSYQCRDQAEQTAI